MVFTSSVFISFLLLFFLGYFIQDFLSRGSKKIRILYLFLSSLLFYATIHPPYLILLLSTITVDWLLARAISVANRPRKRKIFLGLSLVYNLGILSFFKYANFIAENVLKIINNMIEINILHHSLLSNFLGTGFPKILLPLGISFFTFQSMSYTIDVYRRVIEPERSWLHYGFYISFFPQLVAGPIVKAKEFLPQISRYFSWENVPLFSGLSWIVLGAFKKAVLADRLAIPVDHFFQNPTAYSSAFAWKSVFAYSFQIFLDFSGYSDIAIGLALILGFRLPVNFRLPYFAFSFSDFWRRWHISLSSWLRDYLYLSLGGNRVGEWLTYRNLFLVMLLGGLWHGANWNFMIWGGLHGFLLAWERFSRLGEKIPNFHFLAQIPFRISVFIIVTLLWIFFRTGDLDSSLIVFTKLFSGMPGVEMGHTSERDLFLVLSTLAIGHFLGKIGFHPSHWESISYRPVIHSLSFAIAFIIITLLAVPGKPFIYFVF